MNFEWFRFSVGFVAGKGSYGAVYKARDYRTSEMVVVKVISLSEGEEEYEEIRGEMLSDILEAIKERSIFGVVLTIIV
ncbi:serine/threonine-protein kinase 1-like isoform X2 [Vicia villosa]|uniref:serine/threonine-protein kinase 1-like isoform X2 n=1 Tax=Vicia villosa TaxID=3911 RepID=UPI00273B9F91|nr:serine/threonine-protein kinase 1-like isoform X2 [Vicia villosa]